MSEYNNDSILDVTKCVCEITPDCTDFDAVLLTYINANLLNLYQIGVIQSSDYQVTSSEDTWSSLNIDQSVLGAVKSYLPSKVRMAFDPPTSTNVYNALTDLISELEWRLNIQVD